MDYWHHAYTCPYMQSTEVTKIHCENGSRVTFYSSHECHRHIHIYCAGQWESCTISKMLEEHYDYELFNEKTNMETDGREAEEHGDILD